MASTKSSATKSARRTHSQAAARCSTTTTSTKTGATPGRVGRIRNRTDTSTTGFAGQYTAIADPAGGHDDSSQYGVGFLGFSEGPRIEFAGPVVSLESIQLTNNGSAPFDDAWRRLRKKVWRRGGDDEDWLLLTIIGKLGGALTATVDFYLADYRFDDNSMDYIVSDWTELNLADLGVVDAARVQHGVDRQRRLWHEHPGVFCDGQPRRAALGG